MCRIWHRCVTDVTIFCGGQRQRHIRDQPLDLGAASIRLVRSTVELPYWLSDGRERIADFAMHPIRDWSGSVMFLHPSGIDITDRKQTETALREREQRLRWIGSMDVVRMADMPRYVKSDANDPQHTRTSP
jgi:hypothetical protein